MDRLAAVRSGGEPICGAGTAEDPDCGAGGAAAHGCECQDAAVAADAARDRGIRFITIGGNPVPHVSNIAPASAGQLRVAVSTLLNATLRQVIAN